MHVTLILKLSRSKFLKIEINKPYNLIYSTPAEHVICFIHLQRNARLNFRALSSNCNSILKISQLCFQFKKEGSNVGFWSEEDGEDSNPVLRLNY